MQNFANLPYLEVTYLEMSYLSVFGLYRLIIYRPEELFEIIIAEFVPVSPNNLDIR